MQIDDTPVEAVEGDVAAVLGDRRADAGVQQFLDLDHDFRIGTVMAGMAGLFRLAFDRGGA